MRVGGTRSASCTISSALGSITLPVVTLGYGLAIAHTIGESRNQRTFYPYIKTSGSWYVEAHFANLSERNAAHMWLVNFIRRATDTTLPTIGPLTVSVPSRSFRKVGYPTSAVDFGDAVGTAVYKSVIQFTSASDPTGEEGGSDSTAATNSSAAQFFYPDGTQAGGYVPPPSHGTPPAPATPGPLSGQAWDFMTSIWG